MIPFSKETLFHSFRARKRHRNLQDKEQFYLGFMALSYKRRQATLSLCILDAHTDIKPGLTTHTQKKIFCEEKYPIKVIFNAMKERRKNDGDINAFVGGKFYVGDCGEPF